MTEAEAAAWIAPRLEEVLSAKGCTLLFRSTWNLIDDTDRGLCVEYLAGLFAEAAYTEANLESER